MRFCCFLATFLSFSRPLQWDPVDQEISETRDADGVLVLGVDILPSELPREATNHFGGLLVPLLTDLEAALVDDNAAWPKVLEEGCIARAGDLMPKFEYLDQIRRSTRVASEAAASEKWRVITFRGHLFDSGMINKTFVLQSRHVLVCTRFPRTFVCRRCPTPRAVLHVRLLLEVACFIGR